MIPTPPISTLFSLHDALPIYCGDAGHILLSKHFAEDLEHYAHWRSHLHDVGEVTGKHGLKVPLVNAIASEHSVPRDRKSTRLNSSHGSISYAVFCLKKKKQNK